MLDYANTGSIMRENHAILIAELHFIIEREKPETFCIRIAFSSYLLLYRQLLLQLYITWNILHSHVDLMSSHILHSHSYTKQIMHSHSTHNANVKDTAFALSLYLIQGRNYIRMIGKGTAFASIRTMRMHKVSVHYANAQSVSSLCECKSYPYAMRMQKHTLRTHDANAQPVHANVKPGGYTLAKVCYTLFRRNVR